MFYEKKIFFIKVYKKKNFLFLLSLDLAPILVDYGFENHNKHLKNNILFLPNSHD